MQNVLRIVKKYSFVLQTILNSTTENCQKNLNFSIKFKKIVFGMISLRTFIYLIHIYYTSF